MPPFKPHILVVDDREEIRATVKRTFRRTCDVTVVAGVEEALPLLQPGHDFKAIISDFDMFPGKDGVWLYEHLLEHDPELAKRFVLFTGSDISYPGLRVVPKGSDTRLLVEVVHALV